MLALGAFFATVVCLGNAVLAAVYQPLPGGAESRGPSEYLDRRVRKVRHVIERVKAKFAKPERPEGTEDTKRTRHGAWAFGYLPEPVLEPDEFGRDDPPLPARALHDDLAGYGGRDEDVPKKNSGAPEPGRYLRLDVEPPTSWWEPSAPAPAPGPSFEPLSIDDRWPDEGREELVGGWTLWESSRSRNFVHSGLDSLFSVPRLVCDGAVQAVRWWFPPERVISLVQEDDSSVVSRLVQIRDPGHVDSYFVEFARTWVACQDRVFGSAGDAHLFSADYENVEEVRVEDIMYEEGKILLEVMRRVYLSKYFGGTANKLRGELWHVSHWKPIDYVLAPPVLAAYTWYRGWERRLRFGGTKLHIKIEPIARIYDEMKHDGRRMVGAVTIEWQFGSFPLKLVACAGWNEGHAELDFVGIGTDVGAGKQAVRTLVAQEQHEEARAAGIDD